MKASDLLNKLRRDEKHQELMRAKEAELNAKIRADQKLLAPFLRRLVDAGVEATSFNQITGRSSIPIAATPIFSDLLEETCASAPGYAEAILHMVTTGKLKRFPRHVLWKTLKEYPEDSLGYSAGTALAMTASDSDANEIALAASNRDLGPARASLLLGLPRLFGEASAKMLGEYAQDTDLAAFAAEALGLLPNEESVRILETLATRDDSWVKEKARNSLKTIRRRLSE